MPYVYLKSYGGKDNNLLPLSVLFCETFYRLVTFSVFFPQLCKVRVSALAKIDNDVEQLCCAFPLPITFGMKLVKSILNQI